MNFRVLRHRLLAGMILVVAASFSTQAWERLNGHIYRLQLESLKQDWRGSGRTPRDLELNEGFKLGYRALEQENGNPDYHFLVASMHAWRERGLKLWPDQAVAEARKIKENLKAALSLRPSWFEAWILLALVKYQTNEIDQELAVALEKAMETGPYETAVHHGVSYVAPRVWDRISPDLRMQVIETIDTALDNTNVNEFVVEQIVMTNRIEPYREKIESDERLSWYMDKYLEKRKEAL